MLSEIVQVLSFQGEHFSWLEAKRGEFVQVPGAKHPLCKHVQRASCAANYDHSNLGRFFREISRPVVTGALTMPPRLKNSSISQWSQRNIAIGSAVLLKMLQLRFLVRLR